MDDGHTFGTDYCITSDLLPNLQLFSVQNHSSDAHYTRLTLAFDGSPTFRTRSVGSGGSCCHMLLFLEWGVVYFNPYLSFFYFENDVNESACMLLLNWNIGIFHSV